MAKRELAVAAVLAAGPILVAGASDLRCVLPETGPLEGQPVNGPAFGCDGEVLVDVLVVYTPSARVAAGGTPAMLEIIDGHVQYTNGTYAASGVEHRLRLVHAAEISYTHSGSIITDVLRLRDTNDGFLDDVHPLRDDVGGDLVALIVNSSQAGTAFQMLELSGSFASSAFSVMSVPAGGVVFAHETGHNMGCGHNNGPGAPASMFCYSYGHRTPGAEYRTVMSDPPGERVDFFSSPDLEFDGLPLGVSGDGCPVNAADCVRSLNEAALTVSGFRPSVLAVVCAGDVDGDGVVDVEDLLLVILSWGPCPGPPGCEGDLDGDGLVGVDDLTQVVLNWS